MSVKVLDIKTEKRVQFIDITSEIQQMVNESGIDEGVVTVFVPHTTAGLTINENADPDVIRDMSVNLERVFPHVGDYLHMEGNSDAHIKASLMGSSESILIDNGKLLLGIWQGLYFCEFDGPRRRSIFVKIM